MDLISSCNSPLYYRQCQMKARSRQSPEKPFSSQNSETKRAFSRLKLAPAMLLPQHVEHVLDHGRQIVARSPPPLLARGRVVYGHGPTIGDGLPPIRLIRDLEPGDVLPDLVGQLRGVGAGCRQVEVRVGPE